ncbi:hypothetical protein F4821DRAFT_117962 [Hypoxylon rubiginosum]|uniref:Uncharacterized protein n=1 Tax=Hypoxylon rubiginosum TaxID=110542 RepID=A0ACC0D2X9_9PEZI|nr:hypothetical protein F4821DRAFT_117962 [Hypoxylon rubiginosum]
MASLPIAATLCTSLVTRTNQLSMRCPSHPSNIRIFREVTLSPFCPNPAVAGKLARTIENAQQKKTYKRLSELRPPCMTYGDDKKKVQRHVKKISGKVCLPTCLTGKKKNGKPRKHLSVLSNSNSFA